MRVQTKILVIDDEPEICLLLKQFLEIKGYTVTTASSGVEALKQVRDQQPQVVLVDVHMPGMDGLETQRRIREIDADIGVIILTGMGDEDVARQALQDGARQYLVKPLNLNALERAIVAELPVAHALRRHR